LRIYQRKYNSIPLNIFKSKLGWKNT